MNQDQIQNEISTIKNLIEKTRAEAADSGLMFSFIGIGCIVFVVIMMVIQYFQINIVLPAMISLTILFGLLGILIVDRKEKKEKLKSYPKTIAHIIIVGCCLPGILIGIIFPLTGVYPFYLSPIFMAVLFGIMQFSVSFVYDFKYLLWAGVASWAGACIMAYFPGWTTGFTMIGILVIGFVIPGILLNNQHKNRITNHGA